MVDFFWLWERLDIRSFRDMYSFLGRLFDIIPISVLSLWETDMCIIVYLLAMSWLLAVGFVMWIVMQSCILRSKVSI
jgi:hypothetical protein